MRTLAVLFCLLVASSCSMVGAPSREPGMRLLDPTKIYLGRSIVSASRRELDRFACVNGPVFCHAGGSTFMFECRCPLP